jgi:hypothetical protein
MAAGYYQKDQGHGKHSDLKRHGIFLLNLADYQPGTAGRDTTGGGQMLTPLGNKILLFIKRNIGNGNSNSNSS